MMIQWFFHFFYSNSSSESFIFQSFSINPTNIFCKKYVTNCSYFADLEICIFSITKVTKTRFILEKYGLNSSIFWKCKNVKNNGSHHQKPCFWPDWRFQLILHCGKPKNAILKYNFIKIQIWHDLIGSATSQKFRMSSNNNE